MAALRSMLRLTRGDRGAELIEMAIVTPVLLMILAGIFDFGMLFRSWEVVTNAAREGARVGVLPGYSCAAASPDIQSRVQVYMQGSGFPDTSVYAVTTGTSTVATTAGTFDACGVQVTLTQPLPSLGVIAQIFGGNFGTVPVRGTAMMRVEVQASAP